MQRNFSALGEPVFDIAIIGGGATGACIALDATLRGLRVALIDKGDFAAATSAGSSKLMHGGLRYLANGELALVREGLRERRHWSRIAKHLVHPVPFVIPIYDKAKPGRTMMSLGLRLYDWLAFDRNRGVDPMQKMAGYRAMTAAQVLGLVPDVARTLQAAENETGNETENETENEAKLNGGLMYHDGQMLSPERLSLAVMRTAIEAGALAVNYAEATDFIRDGNRITGIEVKDALSRKKTTIRAALTINASGPWADRLMHKVEQKPPAKKLIRSKGIHLVTRNLTRGVALAMPIKGEHLFVLPWMGMSLLATTDTKYDDAPDNVAVCEADIEKLLDKTNQALPSAKLTRKHVVYAYVGLRPLVVDMDDTVDTTYGLSRGSEIYDHAELGGPSGVLSALGGKWTTARRLAEQVVDVAVQKLAVDSVVCRSADTLLACAPRDDLAHFMDEMRTTYSHTYPNMKTSRIDLLSRLYGRLLPTMLASDTSGLDGLHDPVLAAQVVFAIDHEMAMQLTDIVLRRLVEGQTGGLSTKQTNAIAAYMADRLGWSEAELKQQKAQLAKQLKLPTKLPTRRRTKAI